MAELSAEDLATIERGRRAFVARDRDEFLATLDPDVVVHTLPDWPGDLRLEGAAAAWDAYDDFFGQFDSVNMEYLKVEKLGNLVFLDVHCELAGLSSGTPGTLLWTLAGEFDSAAQRFKSVRWFHSHDEAVAWGASRDRKAEENTDRVRRWMDKFRLLRTPDGAKAAVSESWDTDADYYPVRKFPDARPRHGIDEIAEFMASYAVAWDSYDFGAAKIVPIDDVRVFVETHVTAQSHESPATVGGALYHSAWLRDGRILRWEDHLTEAGALRGLGLEEL